MKINKFSSEQIDLMYSDAEFMIFVNRYFSSFDTCIQKISATLEPGTLRTEDFEVYLRIVLANLAELKDGILELERNMSFTYSEVNRNIVGGIRGRLQVNEYTRNKTAIKVPKEYPCVIKTKTVVAPENLYLIYMVDYVINLLGELKKYLILKKGNGAFSELTSLEEYSREFRKFTQKGYFLECREEFQNIKKRYKNVFPKDKYNLLKNRLRKGKVKNGKAYKQLFDWFEYLRNGSLLFVNDNTLNLLRYSEEFANKLFELWCLYSIKKTFINDFNSALIDENDIMEASKGYIFKFKVVTGGVLEVYFQKGNELYWKNQDDLSWKYLENDKKHGLMGIPDITIKYTALKESLIMIDIKNRVRDAGQNSEEVYKMIGYFTNFRRAFSEWYNDGVKRQAALIFRNDADAFVEDLVGDDGYSLKVLSVSPSENEILNGNQFKLLCTYILNMQGYDGITSDLLGGYINNTQKVIENISTNDDDEDYVAYRISEMNHQHISASFSLGELAQALSDSMSSIQSNFFPHIWKDMADDTKRILGMAECLYNGVVPCDTADYAPFCLEYCRALEVQMNALIFEPFKQMNDTIKLARVNKYYAKMNEGRPLTLGECLYCFEKCNHHRFPMKELKLHIQNVVGQSNTFFNMSVNAMKQINEQVRRKAAHTEVMSFEELVQTRQRIMGIGYHNLFYTMLDKR